MVAHEPADQDTLRRVDRIDRRVARAVPKSLADDIDEARRQVAIVDQHGADVVSPTREPRPLRLTFARHEPVPFEVTSAPAVSRRSS